MFQIAILIGLYSYSIFLLGIFGVLNKPTVGADSLTFLSISFLLLVKPNINNVTRVFSNFTKHLGLLGKFSLVLIILQLFINFVGALGPELSFDALWYHLTIPKIFIEYQRVFHIPGSLLYYSDMPKLIEMLYIPGLMYGNEVFAKLIHYTFGIGVLIVIFNLARKYLSRDLSLLAVLIFSSNLVFAWQQTTSFIDLGRTFFETAAFYFLVQFMC